MPDASHSDKSQVDTVLHLSDESGGAVSPPAAADASTSAESRFRLVHLQSSGGLGHIYLAHDEQLHRNVAVKHLQERHADQPDSRARFLQEAEITGRLEHPGIVPVYALGHDAQGRLFYAMRFIRGESLKQAIDHFHDRHAAAHDESQRLLELRQLLRRLIDACNAIAYAHSRGVLHRDIKPDNIMLGPYGETLVVDWGLAKPIGATATAALVSTESILHPAGSGPETPTQIGSAVGTPQFMSPEQAHGELDLLGPASDVYSLGATLYNLLTGVTPFRGADAASVMARVRKGDFLPPRQINARVDSVLNAICLKAMAYVPADRYPTPTELTEDLERWLADEPARAYRGSPMERAARWSRRHRAWTRSVAAALLVVSLVSSVAVVVVRNKQQLAERLASEKAALATREATARRAAELAGQNTDRARQRAEDARIAAETAERSARESALRAEQQYQYAKETSDFLVGLFRASDTLGLSDFHFSVEAGSAEALTVRQLLQRGAQRIPGRFEQQPLVRAALMETLGNVHRTLGLYPEATELLEQSLALRRQQHGDDHPDVAASLHFLGWLRHEMGDYEQSEKLYRQALALRIEHFGEEDLHVADTKFQLAWLLGNKHQVDQKSWHEGDRLYREVIATRKNLLGPRHREVAIAQATLAAALLGRTTSPEGFVLLTEAMAIFENQGAIPQAVSSMRLYLDALAARNQGRFDEAEKLQRQVLQQARGFLGEQHPLVIMILGDLAGLLRKKGDLVEAEKCIRQALVMARKSPLRGHPKMIFAILDFADALRSQGEVVEAESLYREALGYALARGDADQTMIAAARSRLVELLRAQGREEDVTAIPSSKMP